MENADVEEGEPVYKAPLDYGENYLTALIMGCVGFFVVLFELYLFERILRRKNEA